MICSGGDNVVHGSRQRGGNESKRRRVDGIGGGRGCAVAARRIQTRPWRRSSCLLETGESEQRDNFPNCFSLLYVTF